MNSNECVEETNTKVEPLNKKDAPERFGAAANIPHTYDFDLKSVLENQTSTSISTETGKNELLDYLKETQSKPKPSTNSDLQTLLIDNEYERKNLVQVARRAQQDFLDAIKLN